MMPFRLAGTESQFVEDGPRTGGGDWDSLEEKSPADLSNESSAGRNPPTAASNISVA